MAYKDKADQLANQRKHYRLNAADYKLRAANRRRQTRDKCNAYKATLCCSQCPENHISCLEFHHPAGTKEMTVSNAVGGHWAWPRILKEIQKCIVLCANCHRKLHYAERNKEGD